MKKLKFSKKEIIDFFFVEVGWKDIPRIIAGWIISILTLVLFFWLMFKLAVYFHL